MSIFLYLQENLEVQGSQEVPNISRGDIRNNNTLVSNNVKEKKQKQNNDKEINHLFYRIGNSLFHLQVLWDPLDQKDPADRKQSNQYNLFFHYSTSQSHSPAPHISSVVTFFHRLFFLFDFLKLCFSFWSHKYIQRT